MHDRRRVGRDRTRVIGDEQGAAFFGQELEAFPLDAEPMLVHRLECAAGECAEMLAPTPLVDVGAADLLDGFRRQPRERNELAPDAGVDVGEVDVGMGRGRDLEGSLRCTLGSVGHHSKPMYPLRRSPATGFRDNGAPSRTTGRT